MRYGVLFLLLAASVAGLAAVAGGVAWALAWPALDFAWVGVAYVTRRPALLGKRPSGTFAPWAVVLLGPFFILVRLVLDAERTLGREPASDEVAPGVWVGRRPRAHELPAGVRFVVDLTAEIAADPALRDLEGYVAVPVLDGTPPDPAVLRALVDRLRDQEGVLFHCASGHGRSATAAAALLLERGLAGDVDEAEARMRQRRPGIRLTAAQREVVRASR